MKVYLVTYGRYSDFSIHSIHSTPERAEQIRTLLEKDAEHQPYSFYDNPNVWEMEMDRYTIPSLPAGMSVYRVWLNRETGEAKTAKMDDDLRSLEQAHEEEESIFGQRWENYTTVCFARDDDHAIRIARDRYAEHRAIKENIA